MITARQIYTPGGGQIVQMQGAREDLVSKLALVLGEKGAEETISELEEVVRNAARPLLFTSIALGIAGVGLGSYALWRSGRKRR